MRQFLLFLLFLPGVVQSQFGNDFEVLDHRSRKSTFGATTLIGDSIYYVTHNDKHFMTVLGLIDNTGDIQTLFKSGFTSHSKYIKNSNRTGTFLIYNLFDYDVYLRDFYVIEIFENEISIDTIDTPSTVFDVNIDSVGNYYVSNLNSIDYYNGNDLISSIDLGNLYRIFKNIKDDIFLSQSKEINYFDGVDLELRASFSSQIVDFQTYENYNLILTSDSIYLYDINITDKTDSWIRPEGISKLNQLLLQDSCFYRLSDDIDSLSLLKYNFEPTDVDTILSDTKIEDESDLGLLLLDSSLFLHYGLYKIVNPNYGGTITQNSFFRTVDMNNENNYARLSVSIDSFQIYFLEEDTFDIIVHPYTGDTIFSVAKKYTLEFGLTNNSDETITNLNAFTTNYSNPVGPGLSLNFNLDIPFPPDSSFSYKDTIGFYFSTPGPMHLVVPGANFKFLESGNILFSDFISSTKEVQHSHSNFELNIFPNPAQDIITIENENKPESVAIYNLEGQLMYHSKNIGNYEIDVNRFPAGIYFVKARMKRSEQVFQGKFIKI